MDHMPGKYEMIELVPDSNKTLQPIVSDFTNGSSPTYSPEWNIQARNETFSQDINAVNLPSKLKRSRTPFFRLKKGVGWRLEILSATFSTLCLAAMIAVLKVIDGKLLLSWRLAISPNAVISTLSTGAKASMVLPVSESISQLKWLQLLNNSRRLRNLQAFDDASRGPWGSTTFFFSAPMKTVPIMTYLGCLITIIAVAFDPFAQQILEFTSGPTLAAVNSSVTRSTIYDNKWQAAGNGSNGLKAGPERDLQMRAAIIGGLYDRPVEAPFSCPGSNCSYPTFGSIGVCSQCADVTSQTSQDCGQQGIVQGCKVRTPGNFSFLAKAFSDSTWGFIHQLIISNWTYTEDAKEPNLAKIALIRYPFDDNQANGPNDTRWRDTLQAYECSFSFCGLSYNNFTVKNGTVHPGEIQGSSLRFDSNTDHLFHYLANDVNFPGERNFSINWLDRTAILKVFEEIFNGTNRGETETWDVALFQSPNIPATMANIATSMSHRMLAGPNATEVYGDVYKTEVFIHVHWKWLILPIGLVVSTCVLLASVVVATRGVELIPWKSSLTPLLYTTETNLRGNADDETAVWSPNEQDARAKIIISHLRRNGP